MQIENLIAMLTILQRMGAKEIVRCDVRTLNGAIIFVNLSPREREKLEQEFQFSLNKSPTQDVEVEQESNQKCGEGEGTEIETVDDPVTDADSLEESDDPDQSKKCENKVELSQTGVDKAE